MSCSPSRNETVPHLADRQDVAGASRIHLDLGSKRRDVRVHGAGGDRAARAAERRAARRPARRDEPPLKVECKTCHRGIRKPFLLTTELHRVVDNEGIDAAVQRYRPLRAGAMEDGTYDFGEWEMNELARELVVQNQVEAAVAMLELNGKFHPRSTSIPRTLAPPLRGARAHARRHCRLHPRRRPRSVRPCLAPAPPRADRSGRRRLTGAGHRARNGRAPTQTSNQGRVARRRPEVRVARRRQLPIEARDVLAAGSSGRTDPNFQSKAPGVLAPGTSGRVPTPTSTRRRPAGCVWKFGSRTDPNFESKAPGRAVYGSSGRVRTRRGAQGTKPTRIRRACVESWRKVACACRSNASRPVLAPTTAIRSTEPKHQSARSHDRTRLRTTTRQETAPVATADHPRRGSQLAAARERYSLGVPTFRDLAANVRSTSLQPRPGAAPQAFRENVTVSDGSKERAGGVRA